jgi:hypothetical protein
MTRWLGPCLYALRRIGSWLRWRKINRGCMQVTAHGRTEGNYLRVIQQGLRWKENVCSRINLLLCTRGR